MTIIFTENSAKRNQQFEQKFIKTLEIIEKLQISNKINSVNMCKNSMNNYIYNYL